MELGTHGLDSASRHRWAKDPREVEAMKAITQEEWDSVQRAAREVLGELKPTPMDHATTDGCRDLKVCQRAQIAEAERLEAAITGRIPGRLWRCNMARLAAFNLWRGELNWHGWKTIFELKVDFIMQAQREGEGLPVGGRGGP
jgi:hypothetical protein